MAKYTKVNEQRRLVVSVQGHQQIFTGVTGVCNTGSWLRLQCDQGYVLLNTSNILSMTIIGEEVF